MYLKISTMNNLKKIVALTGAGISAESGITTFRDSGGLWEQYDIMEVASIEGWHKNPELMLRFYNDRRKQLGEVEPNDGHYILAELEKDFDVTVVTQNVDNLHERAGSTKIIHLHGELTKARSEADPNLIVDIGYCAIEPDEKAADGSRLRPHIVWFGEAVPLINSAAAVVSSADILLIIGTSLNVYPAAGLVGYADRKASIYLIDPNEVSYSGRNITVIREKATIGMRKIREMIYNG
jgi:NAD-dependent deacetylase